MRTTRNVILTTVAALAMAVGSLALPFSHSVSAASLEKLQEPQKVLQLATESSGDVDVTTELDCRTHTLTAKVKNNTDISIEPTVTFNDEEPAFPSTLPIKPGKTGSYFYYYSGNNMFVTTKVKGDNFAAAETSSVLSCVEPVSFKAQETSDSAIVGKLTNNSTFVPQTVYTQVGNGDVRVETVDKGETKTIALPFNSVSGQKAATVKIGTPAGYESTYWVDLEDEESPIPLAQ